MTVPVRVEAWQSREKECQGLSANEEVRYRQAEAGLRRHLSGVVDVSR
jgi:hypothetical protein